MEDHLMRLGSNNCPHFSLIKKQPSQLRKTLQQEWETNGFWTRMKDLTKLQDDNEIAQAISYIDWALKSNIVLKFALTANDF